MKGNMEIDGEQCRVLTVDECWREDRKEMVSLFSALW